MHTVGTRPLPESCMRGTVLGLNGGSLLPGRSALDEPLPLIHSFGYSASVVPAFSLDAGGDVRSGRSGAYTDTRVPHPGSLSMTTRPPMS